LVRGDLRRGRRVALAPSSPNDRRHIVSSLDPSYARLGRRGPSPATSCGLANPSYARLGRRGPAPRRPAGSLDHVDAHAAGGALDDPHGRVDRVRVEIHELRLGDVPHLLARDLAALVLV